MLSGRFIANDAFLAMQTHLKHVTHKYGLPGENTLDCQIILSIIAFSHGQNIKIYLKKSNFIKNNNLVLFCNPIFVYKVKLPSCIKYHNINLHKSLFYYITSGSIIYSVVLRCICDSNWHAMRPESVLAGTKKFIHNFNRISSF